LDYLSSVSDNYSGSITSDNAGTILLSNLPPATYSDIYVSAGGCMSAAIDPIIIPKPVTPSIPAFPTGSNTDCDSPNGSISLVSADFSPGAKYEIWYNNASHGEMTADADKVITLSGLPTGSYENIYVVTGQQCVSNSVASL